MGVMKVFRRRFGARNGWVGEFPVIDRLDEMRSLAPRCVGMPASPEELDIFRELTLRALGCQIPESYAEVLRGFNGIETRSAVLYGVDRPNTGEAATWPARGIVFASLAWLYDPKTSPWLVIGETDHDVLAISRDGSRFASIRGGVESVVREFISLNALLCTALDEMLAALAPPRGRLIGQV